MLKSVALILLCTILLPGSLGKRSRWDWEQKRPVVTEDSKDQDLQDILDILDEDEPEDLTDLQVDEEYEADPCEGVHCGPGRQCQEGKCVCVTECAPEPNPRRWVCSNQNETYESDCQLYKNRCLCMEESPLCDEPQHKHLHIEYYGECRQIGNCRDTDMVDFPRRMREWLFSVMKDLTEREEISEHYQRLEKEAEMDQSKRWNNAAVWKWCDLDRHPHDNIVSRHELFPLRAPLHSLEHCISPFLDQCDIDDDHSITIQEWATCLELQLDELVAQCEHIDL